MNASLEDIFTPAAGIVVAAAITASILAWIAIARRLMRGVPLVPYEGRCPVPWKGVDVGVIFGLYFLPLVVGLAVVAFGAASGGESAAAPQASPTSTTGGAEPGAVDTQHPAMDLLRQDGTVLTWVLCIVAAVVVAPLAEEFLFRLVLQGWLEAAEPRRCRTGPCMLARGAGPILISSFLFAAVHFRLAESPAAPDQLRMAFLAQICWSLLMVAYAVVWLRFRFPQLTAADLGIDPARARSDIGLGLVAFLAVACPIYLMQVVLTLLCQQFWPSMVPDPIPLFFLALVLGLLYRRTHRLLPSIVLHMALNAASLLMVWLFLFGPTGG